LEQLNNLEAFTFKGLQNTSAALHQCEGFWGKQIQLLTTEPF
jgi:hypothetical protein